MSDSKKSSPKNPGSNPNKPTKPSSPSTPQRRESPRPRPRIDEGERIEKGRPIDGKPKK